MVISSAGSSRQISDILKLESLMTNLESDLFNYTTGRFLANDAYHLRERRRVFNIPGLFSLIAKEMNCKPEQIIGFRKLGEGGFNRLFLVTLDNKFQLVARIPYPLAVAKAHTIASEVATMCFLRSKGIPVPEVYSYSFTSENEAETEYILMEYVRGKDMNQIWDDLNEEQIELLMRQLVELESAMMSISFPAGGSIYYARDLAELSENEGIRLDDEFCMGPDVSIAMWYGRRDGLNVFRGPYKDAKSVMIAGAKKELVYLERFGAPRAPYNHYRRESYNYEKQSPMDHINNLGHYLRVVPWLIPNNGTLNTFCIRHPDYSTSNIRVSTNAGSPQIVSMLDWQNSVVLPLFLYAGVPDFIHSGEPDLMDKPTLPDNFNELSDKDKEEEKERHRCLNRLLHYNYVLHTAVCDGIHSKGLVYPLNSFTRRIYSRATEAWMGETAGLLRALVEMTVSWSDIVTDGTPCPLSYTVEEINVLAKLCDDLEESDAMWKVLSTYLECGTNTWVPAADYEERKKHGEDLKKTMFNDKDSESYDNDLENWFLDDMSEEEWEEYK